MNGWIEDFQQWLLEEGKRVRTVESYCHDVKQFEQYRQAKAPDEEKPLTRFLFVRYKQHLQDRKLAVSTVNKAVNSLKVYNNFLQQRGAVEGTYIQLKKDQIQVATGSEHVVTTLTEDEVEQLLFYAEDENRVSRRNQLILYLLLYTGVRVSELVHIKLDDIDRLKMRAYYMK